MKLFKAMLAMAILFSIGCGKGDSIETDCEKAMLSEKGMVPFDDQDFSCKSFLELFHYNDKQYYLFGNHCADLISYPTDCDGNTLCENGNDAVCADFYENAERIGVIGIEE